MDFAMILRKFLKPGWIDHTFEWQLFISHNAYVWLLLALATRYIAAQGFCISTKYPIIYSPSRSQDQYYFASLLLLSFTFLTF